MTEATDQDDRERHAGDRPRSEPASPLVSRNLVSLLVRGGGISAGVLAVLVLLRVVAVSGWHWHTAAAVAETIDLADIATIGLGTVFEQPILTGVVAAVAMPLTIVQLYRRLRQEPTSAVGAVLLLIVESVVGGVLIVSRHQWWLPIIAVVVFAALVLGENVIEQRLWRPRIRLTVQVLGAMAVGTSLLLAAVVPTPWVPRERIVTTDGAFDGYVLETQAGFLKVLIREKHDLLILPVSDVISRQIDDG